jgi:hypothetical protein
MLDTRSTWALWALACLALACMRPTAAQLSRASKKGVGTWGLESAPIEKTLADSGISWWYNWAPTPEPVDPVPGVEFVSMIGDLEWLTDGNLTAAQASSSTYTCNGLMLC